jgi:hypothetical protein
MSTPLQITEELLAVAQAQLATTPTDTDIITLAFTLVPRIEALAKGQLKGPEKMELLITILDSALGKLDDSIAAPLRASLRDKIVPSVSGLINATKSGDIALGIASAVTIATEVITAASAAGKIRLPSCGCMSKKATAVASQMLPLALEPVVVSQILPLAPEPAASESTASESTASESTASESAPTTALPTLPESPAPESE